MQRRRRADTIRVSISTTLSTIGTNDFVLETLRKLTYPASNRTRPPILEACDSARTLRSDNTYTNPDHFWGAESFQYRGGSRYLHTLGSEHGRATVVLLPLYSL